MRGNRRPWPAVLRACVVLAALAGCGPSQPTRFYTLSTVAEPAAVPRSGQGLVIGLGPISVPQYLDRPDIVTRAGANQVKLGEFNKWAEPLEPLLTRIIAEDLYALLDAKDVIPIPQSRHLPLDRIVEIDFARFDANEAGEVRLDARWRIYRGDNDTLVASSRSLVVEQGAAVPDYDAIVAAMGRAVGQLGSEIAAAIATQAPARERKPRPNTRRGA
jgi:uncharacterized lipoprotein YmbA